MHGAVFLLSEGIACRHFGCQVAGSSLLHSFTPTNEGGWSLIFGRSGHEVLVGSPALESLALASRACVVQTSFFSMDSKLPSWKVDNVSAAVSTRSDCQTAI